MRTLVLTSCGLFVLTLLTAGNLWAQVQMPYSVDFTAGIPSNWTQTSPGVLDWEWSAFGKATQGSAVVDMSAHSGRAHSRIETPPVVFAWIGDATLRFNAAFIRNNFVAPGISLWYNAGQGWKMLDSWAESVLSDMKEANHLLEGGTDYTPPLDEEKVLWHEISVDLSSLGGMSEVQFAFQAEFSNGGWVLIDDVNFTAAVAGLEDEHNAQELRVYPNPATASIAVEAAAPFVRAVVVDLLGRTVLETEGTGGSRLQVDIAPLPAGPYRLQLIDRKGNVCGSKGFVKE